jgi:hypothetical protein
MAARTFAGNELEGFGTQVGAMAVGMAAMRSAAVLVML